MGSMKVNKARQERMSVMLETGAGLCKTFNAVYRVPKKWEIVFRQGRAISGYDGSGERYEYDTVCVPGVSKSISFPHCLDSCSPYLGHRWGSVTWADTLVAACWELREWILEIGSPGDRESDLSAMLNAS